eukprot:1160402-Pelagomonas_calceolata.AAC.8
MQIVLHTPCGMAGDRYDAGFSPALPSPGVGLPSWAAAWPSLQPGVRACNAAPCCCSRVPIDPCTSCPCCCWLYSPPPWMPMPPAWLGWQVAECGAALLMKLKPLRESWACLGTHSLIVAEGSRGERWA